MYNKAIEILNIFYEHGYDAYIVGGYPRDNLLGIDTNDIDICTNAKPIDIINIFNMDSVNDVRYGAIKVIYKNSLFDIATFRKDIKYENNRKPIKIKYISYLKNDLIRRDFTINTMCIDRNGNLIDYLNGKKDLEDKIIKTVGNPKYKIKEDSLRILRAIRFATILNFDIDKVTLDYIKKYAYLVENLSSMRKKEELNKIFLSKNKERGRKLLINYGIDKYLGINNLGSIILCDDIIGVWSQIDFSIEYPFTKLEKDMIKKIREALVLDFDKYLVYKYGLYISTVVGSIKNINLKVINDIYNSLKIYSRKDICVDGMTIANSINLKPGNYLKDIFDDIEKQILGDKLDNDREKIIEYVNKNYLGGVYGTI